MRWHPPTMRTAPVVKGGQTEKATCVCRRVVSADMMVDVSTLSDAQAHAWGIESLFVCDGCIARGVRSGRFTREEFAAALGAPLEVVARLREKRLERSR